MLHFEIDIVGEARFVWAEAGTCPRQINLLKPQLPRSREVEHAEVEKRHPKGWRDYFASTAAWAG